MDDCFDEEGILIFWINFEGKLGPFFRLSVIDFSKTIDVGNILICLVQSRIDVYGFPILFLALFIILCSILQISKPKV